MGPLKGIKVLDLTRVLAGPYATMILADLGAEVIKVERPGSGDDSRAFGPYLNGESAYFMSLNRNKKSITVDMKTPEGMEIIKKLIATCDVLVENFRPGTMEKLGIGYEDVHKMNPSLIFASSSGFGQSGPYSRRPAYDGVVQAMGGIMSITGEKDGNPTRVGPSIGDIGAGLFTAIGVLAALHHREATGEGQLVDVAMLDTQVAMLENAIARYVVTGEIPRPAGNRHASIVPFEPFETKTDQIMVAIGNDNLWRKFCDLTGLEDLKDDERFNTNPKRSENYTVLRPIIAEKMKEKSSDEWQDLFVKSGVPSGPINSVDKVLQDEQILAREMVVQVDHPVAGKMKMPGVPIKLSETPGEVRKAAPVLGEDTEDILKELGYSQEEIEALIAKKAL